MDNKRIRAVAYARVSTEHEDQRNSLENQRNHFIRELSKEEKAYKLVSLPTNKDGVYADEGWSGTKLTRPAFDQMLYDAGLRKIVDTETGIITTTYRIECPPKFDAIFVKDASRFARNVNVDDILQSLKDNGVTVHFLDLGKSTADSSDMAYIQLFFVFAAQESQSRSEKVRFGFKEGAKRGNIYVGGNLPVGYRYVKKDNNDPLHTNMLIANEEAEIVRTIFDLYTEEGLGCTQICNRLYEMGYRGRKSEKFSRSTICNILRNEKYTGTNNALRYNYGELFSKTKKRTSVDYNNEDRKEAREATQKLADLYLKSNKQEGVLRIEPIITREQFEKAQQIKELGRKKYNNDCTYRGNTDYARKIKCGTCGAYYIAQQTHKNRDGKVLRRYRCKNAFLYNQPDNSHKCQNPSIKQSLLDDLLNSPLYYEMRLESIEEIIGAGYGCKIVLEYALDAEKDKEVERLEKEILSLGAERKKLLSLYAKGIYDESELDSLTVDYNERINELTKEKEQLEKSNDEIREDIKLVDSLLEAAEEDEKEIREILEKGTHKLNNKESEADDRKKKLKDVDYITIDKNGNPNIVFKSITEIEKAIAYIDSISGIYARHL